MVERAFRLRRLTMLEDVQLRMMRNVKRGGAVSSQGNRSKCYTKVYAVCVEESEVGLCEWMMVEGDENLTQLKRFAY